MIEGLIICGLAWLGIGIITDEYKISNAKLNSHNKYKRAEELGALEKKWGIHHISRRQYYEAEKSRINYKYKQ